MQPLNRKSYKASTAKVDYKIREYGKLLKNWWEGTTSKGKGIQRQEIVDEIKTGLDEYNNVIDYSEYNPSLKIHEDIKRK